MLGLLLVAQPAGADDRGGNLDVVVEGGALSATTQGSLLGVAPVAQVAGLGRALLTKHIAVAGGLSTLPAPEVFALGAIGRFEWLPLASDPLAFEVFAGSRLLIVQPMLCSGPTITCSWPPIEAAGILGEVGAEVRTCRMSGYRFGIVLSALAGPMSPYGQDHSLRDLYVGGIAGLATTF